MVNEDKKPASGGGGCGFKDAHNTNGRENLCVLKKGHAGDHSNGEYSFSDAAATPLSKETIAKMKERDEKAAKVK